jgi:hypothetical protein
VGQLLQPHQKLVSKTRTGARVTRRYDAARTPLRRLLDGHHVPESVGRGLLTRFEDTNPVTLSKGIGELQ